MIDHPAAPWIASAILLIALGLFAWGRLRYDLVALIALVAVGAFGLVEDPADLVAGFGHPAVVTVAAVLIISRGLQNAGVATLIARQIRPLTKTLIGHIAALSGTVAFASAFMNNVGAIAVFLPVAIASAKERGRNPSLLLMPLAFGSILGGLMTLIGTPPNIIIASFRAETAGTPFNLFDFTPVGLPVALAGLAFLALAGWRLIPKQRTGATSAEELFSIGDYLTEVEVVEDSPLIGKTYALAEEITGEDVVIVGRAAGDGPLYKPAPFQTVRAGDILVLRADPTHLDKALRPQGLRLVRSEDRHEEQFPSANSRLVEAVIKPGAQVEGASADYLRWRSGYALDLLAIARQDTPLLTRIRNQRFEGGDVVLLQADATISPEIYASLGLLPLPERDLNLSGQRRVVTGISIFAGALGLSALGLVPIVIAFLGAIVLFVLTGILSSRDLYRPIEWPVIVLLGAMIPVGQALEATGATAGIASLLLGATAAFPDWALIGLILVLTMTLSDVINNAATALVMAPIGVALAEGLAAARGVAVSADPFLMAVAVGASCAFLTPIGHQSNTLVLGPGGYRFSDYWRLGLPMEIIITLIAVPLILMVWPL